ncbi:MAG: hypothetical protein ABFS32_08565 [Bacteroidota bacterium]
MGFPDNLIIKGDKIKLAPITIEYAEDIFKELTEEIVKYIDLDKPPSAIEETREFIDWAIDQRKAGTDLVLVILKYDELIGLETT